MFFLYIIPIWLTVNPCHAQGADLALDQDSIDYYLQVVEAGERQVGKALASIGYLYERAGRYNSALTYFDRALPLLNGENKTMDVARIHRAKGKIYEIFGDNAEPGKYYLLARISYLKSDEIIKSTANIPMQMSINQHLADIATKRGNYSRALRYQSQVMKALTQLYHDSLQRQAESFNDLLNKEIESSKDTIYVEAPVGQTSAVQTINWWNWRHFAILILALSLAVLFFKWQSQGQEVDDLQQEATGLRALKQQLERQKEELQNLNLKLTKTEKEQRKSNLTKDKIFSIIAHDLRSPINTISGLLNILGAKMTTMGDIELRNLVQDVSVSTERLTQFLDDLLKWSMSQMGQLKPKPSRIHLRKLIHENYTLVKPRLQEKNIHFKASVPEDIDIYADPNMLRLILRNLISNSIKFTRNDGYIAVALKPGDEQTSVIEVSDDGIGISEEQLQQIFDFKGTEINGDNSNQGTGLGLLLCKEFVELNGGTIDVASRLGEGTKFTIKLPNHPGVRQENDESLD